MIIIVCAAHIRPLFDPTDQPSTYFKVIYESKDVIKLKSFLASAILASRQELGKVTQFYNYNPLIMYVVIIRHWHATKDMSICT